MSRNSITDCCALIALSLLVRTTMPCVTGVAQAGIGLGAFSTSTRHMRQLAAMRELLVIAEVRDVDARRVGRMHHHAALGHADLLAVEFDFDHATHVRRGWAGRHHAGLVLDVVHELVAEVLDHAAHRHRRRVAQRADRAALDVVGHRVEQVEVFRAALAVLDAVDHAPQPAGAFAARRALAAALVLVEVRQAQQALDHAAACRPSRSPRPSRASSRPWRWRRSPSSCPSSSRPAAPAPTSRRGSRP